MTMPATRPAVAAPRTEVTAGAPALDARASVLRRLARDKVALIASVSLGICLLASLLAPLIVPYDPYYTDMAKVMQPPSAVHWLGTDNAGRDMLSRIVYGTRNTLILGFAGVIIGGTVGGDVL